MTNPLEKSSNFGLDVSTAANPFNMFSSSNSSKSSGNSNYSIYNGDNSILQGLSSFGNVFGGWGNIFNGIGTLGNLYTGIQSIGIAKDYLDLAQNQYNTNKALMQANLDNSVQTYNNSLTDRLTARAYAETGDSSAYNDTINERKLSSASL